MKGDIFKHFLQFSFFGVGFSFWGGRVKKMFFVSFVSTVWGTAFRRAIWVGHMCSGLQNKRGFLIFFD